MADIGSGHGRLARMLLAAQRTPYCLASDRPGPPGQRLTRLPDIEGLEIRLGDGLSVLRAEDRIDLLVLTGMGARTMTRILDRGLERLSGMRRLVLQPQGDWPLLRRWLWRRGLRIVEEKLVVERKRFYLVLAAEPAVPDRTGRAAPPGALDADDLFEAGPCLVASGDPRVRAYWLGQLRRLEHILERAPGGPGRREASRGRALALRVLAALPPAGRSGRRLPWPNDPIPLL